MSDTAVSTMLWDVPNTGFVVQTIAPSAVASAVEAGPRQRTEVGALDFIDGLGDPAPPIEVRINPHATDRREFEFIVSGGSEHATKVTFYFEGAPSSQVVISDGVAATDRTFVGSGTQVVNVINDRGQRWGGVVNFPSATPTPLDGGVAFEGEAVPNPPEAYPITVTVFAEGDFDQPPTMATLSVNDVPSAAEPVEADGDMVSVEYTITAAGEYDFILALDTGQHATASITMLPVP